MKHLLNLFTLVTLCFYTVSTNSHAQDDVSGYQIETVTYSLDNGNRNATDYNSEFLNPEPFHAHNVLMEDTVFNGLNGVFSNGWEEGQEYDTTQYLHLRVNINPGYIYHLDSITFTGTGTSWYGPVISGLIIYDADTLAGSTSGWQVTDSVLYCVSSMWYSYAIYDVYPYTWHDTLVNWWQINSSTHLDIRLLAWGNIPDTLGNYVPSTGWVVDHIQLHGKVFQDLSTSVTSNEEDLSVVIRNGCVVLDQSVSNSTITVTDVLGRTLSKTLVNGTGTIPLPYNQTVLVTIEKDGRVKTIKVIMVG